MSAVTGPISTLPGSRHRLPQGATCDDHEDRLAVARIQGETDSFGCEMVDLCQECLEKLRSEPQDRSGTCDWCKCTAPDLRPHRDVEEGMCGPVYRVCDACIRKEVDSYNDDYNDGYYDHED